jgi:hypothetical protein
MRTKTQKIIIPKNFTNCTITKNNRFIADTNDSTHYDSIVFPLPKGNWRIESIVNKEVTLVKNKSLFGF